MTWGAETGVTYRLQQSNNLVADEWGDIYSAITASGSVVRTMSIDADRSFYRLTATAFPTGWIEATQLLDDFAWPSDDDPTGQEERGYRYYGRLAADRGDMDGGLQAHSLTVTNGVLVAEATSGPQGTSYVGRWHSAQISLNGFFNVDGLYHAIRVRDGARDVIYDAASRHPRYKVALEVLFP